jgi:asparagine synthetase B (glutamine-hydrolysing)
VGQIGREATLPTTPVCRAGKMSHWFGLGNFTDGVLVLAHERLSIVGVDSGAQPLTNHDESIALAVNGEIYNHRLIRKGLKETYHFKTHSDCEVIIPLVSHLSQGVATSIKSLE